MKTIPDLNKLAKEVFQINKAKGFHEEEISNETLLMLVITELSEAVEADRKGQRANIKEYADLMEGYTPEDSHLTFVHLFKMHIKDTIEDELADVVIRLLDLAGLRGYALTIKEESFKVSEVFSENIFFLVKLLTAESLMSRKERIEMLIGKIEYYCTHLGIDLWLHVELKLKYNKTRERKHGKVY